KRASLETSSKVCASRARGSDGRDLNMRAESKTKLAQLMTPVAIPRQFVDFWIEPLRGGLGPHPGELALGELARGGDAPLHRLAEAAFALEVRPELAVPDRAHRGMARGEVASLTQRPHLLEEAGGHHRVEAVGESLMQH